MASQMPPEYLINETGKAASAGKFFSDPAVIGFRVFSEVRLSADELNSDIQITNAFGIADVAIRQLAQHMKHEPDGPAPA